MAVIFVSTGVSTGLMVDKMMKVAPGGLVVPLLPKQTQLQVQNPRLDVDFWCFHIVPYFHLFLGFEFSLFQPESTACGASNPP